MTVQAEFIPGPQATSLLFAFVSPGSGVAVAPPLTRRPGSPPRLSQTGLRCKGRLAEHAVRTRVGDHDPIGRTTDLEQTLHHLRGPDDEESPFADGGVVARVEQEMQAGRIA